MYLLLNKINRFQLIFFIGWLKYENIYLIYIYCGDDW